MEEKRGILWNKGWNKREGVLEGVEREKTGVREI